MTPMIRTTHSEELVQARVDDVVCFHPNEKLTITAIHSNSIEFNADNCYGDTHLPELLTLQFRPFVVGDPIFRNGAEATITHIILPPVGLPDSPSYVFENQYVIQYENFHQERVSESGLLHKNPLLRPAKGYGG